MTPVNLPSCQTSLKEVCPQCTLVQKRQARIHSDENVIAMNLLYTLYPTHAYARMHARTRTHTHTHTDLRHKAFVLPTPRAEKRRKGQLPHEKISRTTRHGWYSVKSICQQTLIRYPQSGGSKSSKARKPPAGFIHIEPKGS